ncbi:Citrate transporter [Phycisphaerae bacterium RAS1]|nr:Citrate transporter [Phycisphaerae bacterium RAS1]
MLASASETLTPGQLVAAAPFILQLLAIAVLPLLSRTQHWWEHNRNKLMLGAALALLALATFYMRADGGRGAAAVGHVLHHALIDEYLPFMTLLASLYVIAGGIVVRGNIRPNPPANTCILAVGGLLASLIGTTGASMVLIRLLLRVNRERTHVAHTVVFFIFIVSNIGGTLLPIGDPPLFLGFLRGVPFFWTLSLLPQWLVMMIALLAIYYVWDTRVEKRETPAEKFAEEHKRFEPLRVFGLINVVWLLGVVAAVALLAPDKPVPGTAWSPPPHLREAVQVGLALASLATTPRGLRRENEFSYHAISEVAALFIGIFITMQAPLEMLHSLAPRLSELGFTHPWQYFWSSGVLSSLLDNAPTYLVFFETANQLTHQSGPGIIRLVTGDYIREDLLAAISCGAVFMGANTYIGNGPNFMVKAIAERGGVKMPSFFHYMLYAAAVLLPLYILLTALFFLH